MAQVARKRGVLSAAMDKAFSDRLDWIALNVFILYLLTLIFESPMRYALNAVGLVGLVYLRDVALIAVSLTYVVRKVLKGDIPNEFLCFSGILVCHFIISLFFIKNPSQSLFAAKLWLPFFFGLIVSETVSPKLGKLKFIILFAWILLCISIFINYYTKFPWEGLSYDIGGIAVQGNREWTAGQGIRRIAGTTRSSIEAAILLLVCMTFFLAYFRSILLKTVLFILTLIAVMITTTKSAILAFLLIFVYFHLFLNKNQYGTVARICQLAVYLVLIGLPIYAVIFEVHDFYMNFVQKLLFSSFMDRMQNTWPVALELVEKKGNIFLGRGLGGIGISQSNFGESFFFNPADNLLVYLYVSFGIFGLVYLTAFLILLMNQPKTLKNETRFHITAITGIMAIGFAMNCIENAACSIFLGMAFSHFARNYFSKPKSRITLNRNLASTEQRLMQNK
ncbi:O-antigen ligase family protein [Ampullimonas aquatilis]|uniref:O-antigen ligase family protein n=1 Tax=Ampullimonas aquatilis TaxID=1341549 RepID=UPI003C70DAFC